MGNGATGCGSDVGDPIAFYCNWNALAEPTLNSPRLGSIVCKEVWKFGGVLSECSVKR